MKKYLFTFAILLVSQFSHAQEATSPPKHTLNGRQGFFLGLGLGYGGMHFDNSTSNSNRGAFLGNFRIGGGLNEQFIMMAESFAGVTEENNVTTTVSSLNFSTQLFLAGNFYFRPGVGFSLVESETSVGSTTTTTKSDTGFSMVASSGYEFRIRSGFAISPEVNYNFDRVDGNNITNYGGTVGFLWYF